MSTADAGDRTSGFSIGRVDQRRSDRLPALAVVAPPARANQFAPAQYSRFVPKCLTTGAALSPQKRRLCEHCLGVSLTDVYLKVRGFLKWPDRCEKAHLYRLPPFLREAPGDLAAISQDIGAGKERSRAASHQAGVSVERDLVLLDGC
jgi:hypothetical protein